MDIMEDGNLMDKVLILIQRDMEYYKSKHTVLQETICSGVVGGRLDFPRSASFAAIKLVLWWEDEFLAAYKRNSGFVRTVLHTSEIDMNTKESGGIVKDSDPKKFVTLISKSSDSLLEHLHVLTQEALDHADLTVLTGTIGAAALLKNCLWCYIHSAISDKQYDYGNLQICQKKYQEMGEALAERLLDLHTRLLSLYILQDAESLDWESLKYFCECERGSYVIQMWWLYMEGTKDNLWSTVPPKMATRVFSGMLNESLTILAVRYSQAIPSEQRSQLYAVDISNLLLCVCNILPSICSNAEELTGQNLTAHSKIIRDIHSKCQELLVCLVLRTTPLDILYKALKKGLDNIDFLKARLPGPIPWIQFTMSHMYRDFPKPGSKSKLLNDNVAVLLELLVLKNQPQPNWALVLKVLCMREYKVLLLILKYALNGYCKCNEHLISEHSKYEKCEGFLCMIDGSCKKIQRRSKSMLLGIYEYYDLIYSCVYIMICIGNTSDIVDLFLANISKYSNWIHCFDRRQIWNQKRPPWFEVLLDLANPIAPTLIESVLEAVTDGASMFQACAIILGSLTDLLECIEPKLLIISNHIQEMLPTSVIPLGKSVLLHILACVLYTELLYQANDGQHKRGQKSKDLNEIVENETSDKKSMHATRSDLAISIAEALCSLDEDSKHTFDIEKFIEKAQECEKVFDSQDAGYNKVEQGTEILEIIVSELLMIAEGKRSLKILDNFLISNEDWFCYKLQDNSKTVAVPYKLIKRPITLMHNISYIGEHQFDELLSGNWLPDWMELLNTPMGLNAERVYTQIFSRWEFKDPTFISGPEGHIISYLNTIFKQ